MYVDIGGNGSTSDCSIYNASTLKLDLASDDIGLPVPDCLPGDDAHLPYFLVVDDAFPLATYMMRPFSSSFRGRSACVSLPLRGIARD